MGQPTVDWIAVKQGWAADAHYALGRSILEVWTKSPNKPVKDLEEAVRHLKQTLKMNPGHGYARVPASALLRPGPTTTIPRCCLCPRGGGWRGRLRNRPRGMCRGSTMV